MRYLQHDAYLYAWERGYDGAGCWNDDLAKAALRKIREVREAARARKAGSAKAKKNSQQQPSVSRKRHARAR